MRTPRNFARIAFVLIATISASGRAADEPAPPTERDKPRIVSPRPGDHVGTKIDVKLQVPQVPKGKHLWIAVERRGMIWPSLPEVVPKNGEWSGTVHERGTPGNLDIVLIAVEDEGHARILKWHEEAQKTGKYPALNLKTLGATRIDAVKNLSFP